MFYPKWQELLWELSKPDLQQEKRNYIEKLPRRIEISGSHLKRLVNELEAAGLVRRKPDKNRKLILLTERGIEASSGVGMMKGSEVNKDGKTYTCITGRPAESCDMEG